MRRGVAPGLGPTCMLLEGAKQGIAVDRLAQESGRVDGLFARCRHDHRYRREVGVVFLVFAKLPAVHHRHREIQDDGVGPVSCAKDVQRLQSVVGDEDAIVVLLEKNGELLADVAIVLDNEHATPRHGALANVPDRALASMETNRLSEPERNPTLRYPILNAVGGAGVNWRAEG